MHMDKPQLVRGALLAGGLLLGIVVGGKMHVIAGGPTPGGSASSANEIFTP